MNVALADDALTVQASADDGLDGLQDDSVSESLHQSVDQEGAGSAAASSSTAISAEAMDERVRSAAYFALTRVLQTDLPMDISAFYTTQLLAYEAPEGPVSLKDSSFKKLGALVKELERTKAITVKNLKGVPHIASINRTNAALLAVPRLTAGWTPVKAKPSSSAVSLSSSSSSSSEVASSSASSSSVVKIASITALYTPHAVLLPLWTVLPADASVPLTASAIAQLINAYVKTHDLAVPGAPQDVRLDPYLAGSLLAKRENVERLPRRELVERCLQNMRAYHVIEYEGGRPASGPIKGSPPTVEITTRRVSGNSVVTVGKGFEAFGVDGDQLASLMAKRVAASASYRNVEHGKGMEIIIQGAVVEKLVDYLTSDVGVPGDLIKAPAVVKKKGK